MRTRNGVIGVADRSPSVPSPVRPSRGVRLFCCCSEVGRELTRSHAAFTRWRRYAASRQVATIGTRHIARIRLRQNTVMSTCGAYHRASSVPQCNNMFDLGRAFGDLWVLPVVVGEHADRRCDAASEE